MHGILGSSGGTALKTGILLYWKTLIRSRSTIHKCRLRLCHENKKHMWTRSRTLPSSLSKAYLKWSEAKWKLICGQLNQTCNCFLKLWMLDYVTKEEDHPACYQGTVKKPAFLMVWGCISVYKGPSVLCFTTCAPIQLSLWGKVSARPC